MDIQQLLEKTKSGFTTVNVGDVYKINALANIEQWLTSTDYTDYQPQIVNLIERLTPENCAYIVNEVRNLTKNININ